jgi:hypothetical protein
MLSILPSRSHAGRKSTGAKLALKPVHVWGIRVRLQVGCKARDTALFDLALDSKLRGCDLVRLKGADLLSGGGVKCRDHSSAEDRPPGTVRSDRAKPPIDCGLDRDERPHSRRLAVSKPDDAWSASEHTAVRKAGRQVGGSGGPRSDRLWHQQHATDEGLAAVQKDRKRQSLTAAAWPHQAGEHRSLPQRGGGRCAGAFGGA